MAIRSVLSNAAICPVSYLRAIFSGLLGSPSGDVLTGLPLPRTQVFDAQAGMRCAHNSKLILCQRLKRKIAVVLPNVNIHASQRPQFIVSVKN